MTYMHKPGRTPCSHMLLTWLRSHKPYQLVLLGALLIAGLFGIAGMP